MLKLIYSLSDKEITLKYKKRQTIWTTKFIIALVIALGLHSLAFFVFKIHRLSTFPSNILKSSKVYSEFKPFRSEHSRIHVDSNDLLLRPISSPKLSLPKLPLDLTLSSCFLVQEKGLVLAAASFRQIEKYPQRIRTQKINFYRFIEPIKVAIYGPLKPRFNGMTVKKKRVLIGTTQTLSILFEIQVEDRTGKVFETKLKASSGYPEFDQYAKNIVSNLTFDTCHSGFVTGGDLELNLEVNLNEAS